MVQKSILIEDKVKNRLLYGPQMFFCAVHFRYPDELAWQINLTKRFIRKSSSMDRFHKFLVHETETVSVGQRFPLCEQGMLLLVGHVDSSKKKKVQFCY